MKLNKMKLGGSLAGALLLLIGFCLVAGGCESDAVAPQETLPAITERDAAQQAALVATGLARVGPGILTFDGIKPRDKDLGIYPFDFPAGGNIEGSVVLEYFTGGAGGTHVAWNDDDVDYGMLYTPTGEMVTVAVDLGGGVVPIFELTFDLEGPIVRGLTDTAEIFGTGTFGSGESSSGFTIPETAPIVLVVNDYPSGGEFIFTAGGIEVRIVYDGDDTADVFFGEDVDPTFTVDLDTGLISPVGE